MAGWMWSGVWQTDGGFVGNRREVEKVEFKTAAAEDIICPELRILNRKACLRIETCLSCKDKLNPTKIQNPSDDDLESIELREVYDGQRTFTLV